MNASFESAPAADFSPPEPTVDPDAIRHFVLIAKGKAEWEQTVDAMEEPVALQDGVSVRRGNRALALAGGVTVQQLPGKSCHELLAGRATPCPGCPLAATTPVDRPQRCEVETADGRTLEVSLSPLVGTHQGLVARHRDVTSERSTLARLREHERLASVGRLAAGAAHEINNPLSFLIANLSSLGRDVDRIGLLVTSFGQVLSLLSAGDRDQALRLLGRFQGAPQVKALEALAQDGPQRVSEALEGAQRVAGIVRALRRLAADRTSEPTPLELKDSVDRALGRLRGELALERLTVEWDGPPPALPIDGQPQALDEAIYHVLHNALDHPPAGT
ncbi:MAG: sensor histidine kinase, partial [Deltaproteobacteria bacterium]